MKAAPSCVGGPGTPEVTGGRDANVVVLVRNWELEAGALEAVSAVLDAGVEDLDSEVDEARGFEEPAVDVLGMSSVADCAKLADDSAAEAIAAVAAGAVPPLAALGVVWVMLLKFDDVEVAADVAE